MEKPLFPHIQKSVDSFLYDEEGNIPVNKVLTIGSMLLVLGYLLNQETFAAHSSHRSHSSHSSHRSGYGGYGGGGYRGGSYGGGGTSYGSGTTSKPVQHVSHNNTAPSAETMENMQPLGAADQAELSSAAAHVQSTQALPETPVLPLPGKK